MCLAFPARVVEVKEKGVVVEALGERVEAGAVVEGLGKGDYVLVQQGFAVEKLSEGEAGELTRAWEERRAEKGRG